MIIFLDLPVSAWELMICYLDVPSYGRLLCTCAGLAELPAKQFWDLNCSQLYGPPETTAMRKFTPKELIKRVIALKTFARNQQKELEAHSCYGAVATEFDGDSFGTRYCCDINGSCPLQDVNYIAACRHPENYDFFVRLRYDHGRKFYQGFHPEAGQMPNAGDRFDSIWLCLLDKKNQVPIWEGLRLAQDAFDERDIWGGPGPRNASDVVREAWANTGVCIVAMHKEDVVPIHIGSAMAFDGIHCDFKRSEVCMDFYSGTDENPFYDALEEVDRFWYFEQVLGRFISDSAEEEVEWYDIGFILCGHKVRALALCVNHH